MSRNIEMFDRVADAIEAHPEKYDQTTFGRKTECGTAYCVAGWTAYLDGWKPSTSGDFFCVTKGDHRRSVIGVAHKLLGLVSYESADLFDSNWCPPWQRERMTVPEALRKIGRGELDP